MYVGARFTYREIMESREVNFKFKAIVEHYLLREEIPETSLESELYYLKPDSFTYRTLEQLHARVKINRLVVKKSLFHKQQQVYQETVLKLHDFTEMPLEEKQRQGVVVEELILPKFALLSFAL